MSEQSRTALSAGTKRTAPDWLRRFLAMRERREEWSVGVMEYWGVGVLGCWSIGVLEYWGVGVLGCWSIGVLEYWSVGVLECWSIGVLGRTIRHYSITPTLHYSTTPSLQYSITPSLHHSIHPVSQFFQHAELRAAGAGVVRDFRVARPNGLALHPAHLRHARAAKFGNVGCTFECVIACHLAAEFFHQAIFKAVESNDR